MAKSVSWIRSSVAWSRAGMRRWKCRLVSRSAWTDRATSLSSRSQMTRSWSMISRCSSGGRFINDHGGSVVLGGLFVVEVAMMLWVLELELIKSSVTGQGELGCKRT
jgi:hypothetical protein